MSGPLINRLPAEIHSSAHQVRYENSVVGEFELRIYRGTNGPVVILEETSSSPMPLEYVSEYSVTRFLDQVPNSTARFFERHLLANHEVWVEVGFEAGVFYRRPCQANEVIESMSHPAGSEFDSGQSAPGRIQEPFAAQRRR